MAESNIHKPKATEKRPGSTAKPSEFTEGEIVGRFVSGLARTAGSGSIIGENMKVVIVDATMPRVAASKYIRRKLSLLDELANSTTTEKVDLEVGGVPAKQARALFRELQIADSELYEVLALPKTTFIRRMSEPKGMIDCAPGKPINGFADLLLRLEGLLQEYADADAGDGFDAAEWLGQWLREPNPALGGKPPADLMKSPTGRNAVTRVLGAVFSGAYQ